MDLKTFLDLASEFNLIPVYEVITADMETPVSAFLKLKTGGKNCFLLESVEGIGTIARYSYIGLNPIKTIENRGLSVKVNESGNCTIFKKDIFAHIKDEISCKSSPSISGLPAFTGGLVGYLGFENISLIEPTIEFEFSKELPIPDSIFGVYHEVVVFDHLKHQMIIIKNTELTAGAAPVDVYENAKREIRKIKILLSSGVSFSESFNFSENPGQNENKDFFELVDKAKQNIINGDVFQLVLSKRFSCKYEGSLFNLYRALRIINPSPYMYYMEFDKELVIIGTSPEDLLKVTDRKATILPIAGTRKRGKNEVEDKFLSEELLSDPKEISEHTMLVDLARNDLGRVCKFGSVKVTEEMKIHYYSHVMHIVSRVEGMLKDDMDCIDALKASFPAGTVTGAPKIRAVQLLSGYENIKRNIYAGAIGYIDFKGNLDMCIAIRTFFADNENIIWQAGAGIVADSIPALESKEIQNKSAVLVNALKFAEVIDENSRN